MKPIIFSLFNHPMTEFIATQLKADIGKFDLRLFPDEEVYLKINTAVKDKDIIIIDSLERPNNKILPLLFFARTAQSMGAKKIGLVAPYLPYLRQDKHFQKGDSITSRYFAELLSTYLDWLVTVEPHLHRYHNLNEIYSMPTKVIHITSVLSQWIKKSVNRPILIGPDSESQQWVSALAKYTGSPYIILEKTRQGDKQVEIKLPDISDYKNHTPVLVDDIISTGNTMLETIKHLDKAHMRPSICIGVHAIFAGNAYQKLLDSTAEKVITCNTVFHESNEIDVTESMVLDF